MNRNVVDMLLDLRLKLDQEGEIGTYATQFDNAESVCVRVIDEVDLILKEITA